MVPQDRGRRKGEASAALPRVAVWVRLAVCAGSLVRPSLGSGAGRAETEAGCASLVPSAVLRVGRGPECRRAVATREEGCVAGRRLSPGDGNVF